TVTRASSLGNVTQEMTRDSKRDRLALRPGRTHRTTLLCRGAGQGGVATPPESRHYGSEADSRRCPTERAATGRSPWWPRWPQRSTTRPAFHMGRETTQPVDGATAVDRVSAWHRSPERDTQCANLAR